MSEPVIDAGEVLRAQRREGRSDGEEADVAIEGERGPARLGGGRRPAPVGARVLVAAVGVVVLVFIAVLAVKAYRLRHRATNEPKVVEGIEKRVPALKLAPPSSPGPGKASDRKASELPAPEKGLDGSREARVLEAPEHGQPVRPTSRVDPGGAVPGRLKEDTIMARRLSRGFGSAEGQERFATMRGEAPGNAGTLQAAIKAPGPEGPLEEKLEEAPLKGASASVLSDRDYALTEGAVLDCVLETRIVSSVPGMITCHLSRDVYSTSGRVVLLDRGSRLVGRYEGGVQEGQSRIFVLWTRAETPNGVVITLDSPGTGALGEAGVGGSVDRHFWDRFGAAMMVSLIGSGTDAIAARMAGPQRGTTVNIDTAASATKDVVARTYEGTMSMPPTLYVNQGERIGVFVARDLHFRDVYGLERTFGARERP